ncbi:MAG TPA: TrkA family potassium uptake protein [Anaerolineales bacterium]|nr:TrkA family potassium uptake protein [Anaerolineales bacterium]
MRVIIMGCGRVGEQVSRRMDEKGHHVVVIDADERVRDRLGPKFRGEVVVGVGFDREVLLRAGIENADAFAATSSSDNANIIAARIARNIYHVPRVVARLFDPRRAEIYQRLGLVTISSTNWGAERIYELITHADLDAVQTFGQGEVALIEIEAPPRLVGRMVNQVTIPGEISVVAITRQGEAQIPVLGSEFREGDRLHFAVHARAMSRFEMLLGLGEGA